MQRSLDHDALCPGHSTQVSFKIRYVGAKPDRTLEAAPMFVQRIFDHFDQSWAPMTSWCCRIAGELPCHHSGTLRPADRRQLDPELAAQDIPKALGRLGEMESVVRNYIPDGPLAIMSLALSPAL